MPRWRSSGRELAIPTTLDVTPGNTATALAAHHEDLNVACWAPDAREDIRLAAAIVTSAHSLRQLIAEYDSITHTRIYNETPYYGTPRDTQAIWFPHRTPSARPGTLRTARVDGRASR